jgi:Xaa-Pro aminopeptidase
MDLAVHEHRVQALRNSIKEWNIDAFISFCPFTNEYLCGFRGSNSAVLVTQSAAVFVTDFRYREQAAEQVRAFEIFESSDSLEVWVGEWLTKAGLSRVGVDGGAITLSQYLTLKKQFSGEIKNFSECIVSLRARKDDAEKKCIRAAVQLTESVVKSVLPLLEEGVRERDIAAELEYRFKKQGALGSAFPPIVLFGSHSSLPHGVPGDTPLAEGDIVLIDCGAVVHSYCADLTRTFYFGSMLPAWFAEMYEVTLCAQRAALDAVSAGAACRDVDAVARTAIKDAGFGEYFGHGLGHGVGLEIHEAPRLNPRSDALLQEGMCITVEPGIYLPGRGGVRIEDLVFVEAQGCEVVTTLDKEMRVLCP